MTTEDVIWANVWVSAMLWKLFCHLFKHYTFNWILSTAWCIVQYQLMKAVSITPIYIYYYNCDYRFLHLQHHYQANLIYRAWRKKLHIFVRFYYAKFGCESAVVQLNYWTCNTASNATYAIAALDHYSKDVTYWSWCTVIKIWVCWWLKMTESKAHWIPM
jgi:hypothetical protein